MIAVNIAFEISNYPVSFTESQLSFSGERIKSHYQTMTEEDIQTYIYAQLIDYGFMISYGIFIFILGIYIGRKFFLTSTIRYIPYSMGMMGLIAMAFDMIENMFIILMANNPLNFPNSFAILHSSFAAVKFALLGLVIIITLFLVIMIITQKTKDKTLRQKV